MCPLLKDSEGIWIGWAGGGEPGDPSCQAVLRDWAERDRYFAVDLAPEIEKRYYEGFSNQALWPLFHHFPDLVRYSTDSWDAYRTANECYRDAVVEHYRTGDLIWVHDYHLMLLPGLLREALPDAAIGWFLHIPFPSSEVFRILPRRDELLLGLLGADLLAFHTHSHLRHFRSSLMRILGVEASLDRVDLGPRVVRLEALPIGIAADEFVAALKAPEATHYREELERRFHGQRLIVAVDRLDYTKGIPERLRTYRRLLQKAPGLRGRVALIQVAVPSREGIGAYSGLQRRVNELVGEINGQFGTPEWTPVVYMRRGISRPQLAALYAAADVAWVGPLRDGMNLVAKEFVASKPDSIGALVLSEFAGAAEDLGAEAFTINPYDEERTAEAVERALSADAAYLRNRMARLHARVLRNNVFAWGGRFLAALRGAVEARRSLPAPPRTLPEDEVVAAYRTARHRALFLDYDGTLVGYAPRPEQAAPGRDTADLLERLAAVRENTAVLISGRRAQDLEDWFGRVPHLWLAAEHGALVRSADGGRWEALRELSSDWKQQVRPVLEHFCDRTPGSLIEEKQFSLTWHYRMAEPEFGEWFAKELASTLDELLADTELRATRGVKNVEVRPVWANKGEAVRHVLDQTPAADFRFAAGDDRTDEDTFAALDPEAWTVKIGQGPTRARFSLPDSERLRAVLERLAGTESAKGA